MVVQVLFVARDDFGDDAQAVTRWRLPEHRPVPAGLRLEVALLWDGFCRRRRSVVSVCHLRHVLLDLVRWWRVRVDSLSDDAQAVRTHFAVAHGVTLSDHAAT